MEISHHTGCNNSQKFNHKISPFHVFIENFTRKFLVCVLKPFEHKVISPEHSHFRLDYRKFSTVWSSWTHHSISRFISESRKKVLRFKLGNIVYVHQDMRIKDPKDGVTNIKKIKSRILLLGLVNVHLQPIHPLMW